MDGSHLAGFVKPVIGTAGGLRRRRQWLRQLLLGAAGALAPAGIGLYGEYYRTIGRFLVSTDDAYVQADSVIISPKVSGYYRTALAGTGANVEPPKPASTISIMRPSNSSSPSNRRVTS